MNPIVDPDPNAESLLRGGAEGQVQPWPGLERRMRPLADHGEQTYRGSGKLSGRRSLVTGGDSGIGRAVSIAFAREGADVAIAYYDEHEDAAETVRWIDDAGRRAAAFDGDLGDPAHCRDVVAKTVGALGGLDLLVNNAGLHVEGRFDEISPDQLERTFRANFFSIVWLTQAALGHMGPGSAIVNTGSVTGLAGHPSLIDYAATKAAIHNLTKSLASVLAPRGIRVNCVSPGPVWTPLITAARRKESVEGFGGDTYWKRPAQPAEIAPSFVFLASADSRYFTGEILAPTGTAATTR